MFVKTSYSNSHGILIIISHIIVFIAGLYIASGNYRLNFFQKTYRTLIKNKNITSFFDIGTKYRTDKVTFHRYDIMYEKYLQKYVGTNVSILEIGLGCGMEYGPGASAYLWRSYLGPQADIHFLEYNQKCAKAWYTSHGEKLNVTMHYGSQEDAVFLNSISTKQGYFDVIVDDGGHSMKQQITSITHLVAKVRSGGIYVIEDLQTSYTEIPDAGYLVNTSTIELIKRLVDDIHTDSPSRKSAVLARKIFSFEISNKICFFNIG